MTKVSREDTKVIIDFDTVDQAIKCEEQTKWMFEHPKAVQLFAKMGGKRL